jgi:hypothetical protein
VRAARIIECRQTPQEGCSYTQSRTLRRQLRRLIASDLGRLKNLVEAEIPAS